MPLLLVVGALFFCACTQGEIDWTKGDALITDASQLSGTAPQSAKYPLSNLLRPESDGVGTNQYIYHTAWTGADVIPASEDPYLQVHFMKAQRHIIFSLIGSAWGGTFDTPLEVEIQAANLPDGEWKTVQTISNMDEEFTSLQPERYTSPHVDLGAKYSDVKFLVKKTMGNRRAGGSDKNGILLCLGRFQVYQAVKTVVKEPKNQEPVDPKANINLVFIGNSITYGATLPNPTTQAPPIICRQLVEAATKVPTQVYNGGHSGITTWGYLPGRLDFTLATKAARTFVKNNGGLLYFSIMLGTNDSAITGPEGSPVSIETYKDNMKKILDELVERFPDCRILLNYPIWYSPNTHNGARYLQEGLDRLHSYYPVIDELVAAYDQVYAGDRGVWEFFEDNKELFTSEPGNSGTFYLHPNEQGAIRLAEIWTKSLLQLMKADGIECLFR